MKLIKPEDIFIVNDLEGEFATLKRLAELAVKKGIAKNVEAIEKSFIDREEMVSTNLGNEIAIPHAIHEDIQKTAVFILLSKKNITWRGDDEAPFVKYVIAMMIPKDKQQQSHMNLLSHIARRLLHEETLEALKSFDKEKIALAFEM